MHRERAWPRVVARSTSWHVLLASLVLFATPWSRAEENPLLELTLEQLQQLPVTGATRLAQSAQAAPAAVTVLTRDEIRRLGVDSLEELMNLVPGYQSQRASDVSVRYGFSVRGRDIGNSGDILVLLDGQRLLEPRSGSVINAVPLLPLDNIERIEFIRGPGSALYGSNAMMGVINIVTVSVVDETRVAVGSQQRRRAALMKTVGDTLRADVFLHYDADDGAHYQLPDTFSPAQIDTSDPRSRSELYVKLTGATRRLYLQHHEFATDDFYVLETLANGFNRSRGRFSALALEQDWQRDDWQSHLRLDHIEDQFQLNTQLAAAGALTAISQPTSTAPFLAHVTVESRESRLAWDNDWRPLPRHSLQFGLEWRGISVDRADAASNFDLAAVAAGQTPIRSAGQLALITPINRLDHEDVLGLYGQYHGEWGRDTEVTLGLRFDRYSDSGDSLSPRLGLVQAIGERQWVKLLYGQAFRAPSQAETGLINNPVVVGNPALRAETVHTAEAIWLAQGAVGNVSLGYFENHFRNAIVQEVVGGTRAYVNRDQSPSRGMELEALYRPGPVWLGRLSYTQLFANAEASYREARRFGAVELNRQVGAWNANVSASYHGPRRMAVGSEANRQELPSYWWWTVKLGYLLGRDWELQLQVKNLFDQDARMPTRGTALAEGIPARGREWLLGLRWLD